MSTESSAPKRYTKVPIVVPCYHVDLVNCRYVMGVRSGTIFLAQITGIPRYSLQRQTYKIIYN